MSDEITTLTWDVLQDYINRNMSTLSDYYNSDDIDDSISQAKRDTGFTIPNSNSNQISWLIKRTKRNLLEKLWQDNVLQFQINKIYLNQKFANLDKIIDRMDKEWEAAKNELDYGTESTAPTADLFGHKIEAGFVYGPVTARDMSDYYTNEVAPVDEDD